MPANNFRTPEGDLENESFITDSWLIDQFIGDELWSWGLNASGQLGINNSVDKITPVTTFAGGTNWKQVEVGSNHTAAIKTDGTLWTWGENSSFAPVLGTNNQNSSSTPVTTFAGGTNWKQVSVGSQHTAAIKTDGSLWTWGGGFGIQLGINNSTFRLTPVTTFAGGNNWKQVSCGVYHTAAIKTDGSLWIWGLNYFTYGTFPTVSQGLLGTNDILDRSTPVTTFIGGYDWKQVSCGFHHTAAIKTDGSLWVWGSNRVGYLGTNDNITRSIPVTTFAGGNDWKQVSCDNNHTAAIKTDGSLWVWGLNGGTAPTLGINEGFATKSTPVTTFAGGNNWKQVSCGYNFMSAIKTDGTLWVWGANDSGGDVIVSIGQLGVNDTSNRPTPVTTFAGGNNWKQVSGRTLHVAAITSGPDY